MAEQKKHDYISITYDISRAPKAEYPLRLVEYLMKRFRLKPGYRLLDVGCGRGDMLEAFSNNGFVCHAVDKSLSTIENIDKNFEIKLLDLEKESLPYPENYFDIIFSKSVIEHMWDPFFLMSEIHRVLRPGGMCIMMTPDWISQMKTFYEDPTHCRPFVTDSLRDLLLISNFKDVQTELFFQHHLIWYYPFFRYLAFLLRVFLSTRKARKLTELTKIQFFRWAVELMVLGTGIK